MTYDKLELIRLSYTTSSRYRGLARLYLRTTPNAPLMGVALGSSAVASVKAVSSCCGVLLYNSISEISARYGTCDACGKKTERIVPFAFANFKTPKSGRTDRSIQGFAELMAHHSSRDPLEQILYENFLLEDLEAVGLGLRSAWRKVTRDDPKGLLSLADRLDQQLDGFEDWLANSRTRKSPRLRLTTLMPSELFPKRFV